MSGSPETTTSPVARRIPIVASAIVIAVGSLVLAAWASGMEKVSSVVPGLTVMIPNTAAAFIGGGLALFLLTRASRHPLVVVPGYLFAVAILFIGAGTFVERVAGLASPLDLLLFGDAVRRYPYRPPGQMAINSAISMTLLGGALLLLDVRTGSGRRPSEWLTLGALSIAFLALVGYLFDVAQLYTFDVAAGMALLTALAFFTFGAGVFFARPNSGTAALLIGDDAGALVARRLIPGAVILPLVLGWLWLRGREEALIGREAGISLFVVAVVAGVMTLVLRSARQARANDEERRVLLAREQAARTEAEALAAERQRLFASEQSARREAEGANAAKMQFLTNMSHELRTPLNAIAGYAELIELGVHGPVTAEQRDALGRLQRAQRHLLALINDILNFAKLEAGRVELTIDDVPVRPLLDEIDALIEPQLRAKSLQFRSLPCDPALTARADVEKVRQILLNLLANAVKFTEPGGSITVSASALGDEVAIEVRDTGIGIPADKLEQIFDPFVQIQRTLTSSHAGAGLGLAISRDLARAMGGDLAAASEVAVGSCFTVRLPVGAERQTTSRQLSAVS